MQLDNSNNDAQQPQETTAPPAEINISPSEQLQSEPQVITGSSEDVQPKLAWYKTKRNVIIIVLILLGLLLLGVFVATTVLTKDTVDDVVISKPARLAAAVGLAEGAVQLSSDGQTWRDVSGGETVNEQDYVRTLENSRAVLLLDEGSALRLNHSTVIQLISIESNNVEILLEQGEVYSRVVEDAGRAFAVITQRERFEALGTAYSTSTAAEGDQVEVYQSAVKLESADVEVDEGNLYNTLTKEKVALDIAALQSDEFAQWNKDQDSQNDDFKNKLGVLGIEPQTETEATDDTNSTAAISLTSTVVDKGIKLDWVTSGVSDGDGYKIVRSTTDAMPTYENGTAIYVSDGSDTSYVLGLNDGKSYFIRLCIYRAASAQCDTYSNSIKVTAPFAPTQEVVKGGVLLSLAGNRVSWTFSGSAPHGFKVVMAANAEPSYPTNAIGYVNPGVLTYELPGNKPAGVYKVKVCKYTASSDIAGGCTDYSNSIEYTIK